ncbi:vitamin B12 dependent-methionine synthase activation domain-containing protein [Anaeromassilibacillus senegalensis]|uniref:Vitamin B12 dependent methionine synthase activation subunit n=1 Tax=Anaeromassilibacillus senegalensis TaxID=1673717 RepID=A0ABS9CLZ9_9FIRM|nr:vitamin B12 dependent-methionine synthase activation domain-containing protein [Anaeromassilibacillus senegalensis]MCF2652160.1 Vitamin B12 dependent methionine synthase activation subunit [Anaeromassilibacillus senegalensis]
MKLKLKEVLRYLGFRGRPADAETVRTAEEIAEDFLHILTPKCVYKRYAVEVTDHTVTLDGWRIESEKLAHHLRGCKAAYLFAATLGVQADRRIRQIAARSMSRGTVANAVCSALIESYCDEMQAELAERELREGLYLRPRFSPGYGDFALESQREIFARLECEKRIGVALTDTLLMTPVKSVSAVIGVADTADCTYRRCQNCTKTDCAFREGGGA